MRPSAKGWRRRSSRWGDDNGAGLHDGMATVRLFTTGWRRCSALPEDVDGPFLMAWEAGSSRQDLWLWWALNFVQPTSLWHSYRWINSGWGRLADCSVASSRWKLEIWFRPTAYLSRSPFPCRRVGGRCRRLTEGVISIFGTFATGAPTRCAHSFSSVHAVRNGSSKNQLFVSGSDPISIVVYMYCVYKLFFVCFFGKNIFRLSTNNFNCSTPMSFTRAHPCAAGCGYPIFVVERVPGEFGLDVVGIEVYSRLGFEVLIWPVWCGRFDVRVSIKVVSEFSFAHEYWIFAGVSLSLLLHMSIIEYW